MAQNYLSAAATFNAEFAFSEIGKIQRKAVLSYLEDCLKKPTQILEVNCGSGYDAAHLAELGHQVLATDISEEMVRLTQLKSNSENLNCAVLNSNYILDLEDQSFDLIFSNFGGLNCLSPTELHSFLKNSYKLIQQNGQLILVIMGRKSIWENVYFKLKKDRENYKRRQDRNAVFLTINGTQVPTWYYAPKEIEFLAEGNFKVEKIIPIGFFVPPAYLEEFFKNKKWSLKLLSFLDGLKWSYMANYADHFLIHLKKVGQ